MKRTHSLYGSSAWKALRHQALIRDGYRCVVCGTSVVGKGTYQVDHIQSLRTHPHLALSLANVRVLCVYHHAQRHRDKGMQRIVGYGADGMPLDLMHHWLQSQGGNAELESVAEP